MFGVCCQSQTSARDDDVEVPPSPVHEQAPVEEEDVAIPPVVQAQTPSGERGPTDVALLPPVQPSIAKTSRWAKLGGEELESALRDGLVKCLNSRYLVERSRRGVPLVRRQDMPEEAYIGLDQLKHIGLHPSWRDEDEEVWLPLMIVSYAWLSPRHPDPFGETLGVLAEALGARREETYGVIIDFTALPQEPRTDADKATFKLGLPLLNRFYSHPHVIVLKVTKFPRGYPTSRSYELPRGYKPAQYNDRGWCFAESAMAGLGKSPTLVCDISRFNLDSLGEAGSSVVSPQPPLRPEDFNTQLRKKTFTQPKADTARVQNLYRDAFQERLRTAKSLHYSMLDWQPDTIVRFALALAENEMAETLELSFNHVGGKGMEALRKVLCGHRTLKELQLEYCNLGACGVLEVGKMLKVNSALTTLDLTGAFTGDTAWQTLRFGVMGQSIGAVSAQHLAEGLKVNTSLTELQLCFNNIGAEGARCIAEALKVNTALTTLLLGSNSIGAEGARCIAEAVKVNTALTTLWLDDNSIRAGGAQWLALALVVNTTITTLSLEDNSICNEGAWCIAEALKVNTALTELDLGFGNFGAEGARCIAEALKVNTALTQLDLHCNSIGAEGARYIAEALRVNIVLTNLDLSSNDIGDEGARCIAEALTVNAALTQLHLVSEGARCIAEVRRVNSTLAQLDIRNDL